MDYNITATIQTIREKLREAHGQTVVDEMDDEDLIMFALKFLGSTSQSDDLE